MDLGPGFASTPPMTRRVFINADAMIIKVIISARHAEELVLFLVNVDMSFILRRLNEPILARHPSMEIMVATNQL